MVVAVVLEKIIITDYLHAEANEWNELSWLTQHVIYHCLTFLKDFIVNCSLFPHGFTEKKNTQPSFAFWPFYDDFSRLLTTISKDHWVPRMLFALLTLIRQGFLKVAFCEGSIWPPFHISGRTNPISISLDTIVKQPN